MAVINWKQNEHVKPVAGELKKPQSAAPRAAGEGLKEPPSAAPQALGEGLKKAQPTASQVAGGLEPCALRGHGQQVA